MHKTYKITLKGQVQGVGFRPFVFSLALKHGLFGEVYNNAVGVIVHLNASSKQLHDFINELLLNPPISSIIKSHQIEVIEFKVFLNFNIITSKKDTQLNIPLTPDFATCAACKTDLLNAENRRIHYPFTTCVNCGPRYAITTKFPFEREHTSLSNFSMCSNCQSEYENPKNRRFHSQTNSCPDCGVQLTLVDTSGNPYESSQQQLLQKVSDLLNRGHIVAIKNTNGYVLCCDANHEKAIKSLRHKKKRPTKPFALLYPDLKCIKSQFNVTEQEENALTSSVAPIVILPIQNEINNLKTELVAPNLKHLGVMLPSSALLCLLMDTYKKPIIATSGNTHGSAIHFANDEAARELKSIADYFLHHNLDIQFPQDDSVLKFSSEQQIIIRRSRGLAPNYLDIEIKDAEPILAMGAHLKSTFAYVPNHYIYVSQYFGNLDNYEVLTRFQSTITKYIDLFDCIPKTLLIDAHPQYQSSLIGKELSEKWNTKLTQIQHHKAHFASVLGEHDLFEADEAVLGVIWDGTGLGDDSNIWGGEFFSYHNHQMNRLTHFDYFDWIAGDKMAEEPRLSLLSLTSELHKQSIQHKFSDTEWTIYNKLLQNNTLKTSSVGRLFDAMASLLNLIDLSTYEGEAAMLLEQCALDYKEKNYIDFLECNSYNKVPSKTIIQQAFNALQNGTTKERIAASFIHTMAAAIICIVNKNQIKAIACSGGVFQNAFLLSRLKALTKNTSLMLKFNRKLSPNDENISFGQLMYYTHIKV
ncbi:carbamoyltransferase HypF [Geojedonia litorea]|uniref:Carbamoyltransferase n=1 Tax=Geojedonia litorea TaxID=1268269 RepID=A0ABV9N5Y1_9FLAO